MSLLAALRSENRGRPPVWLMRQAGRYMPQYRLLREQHSLWELFHKSELAAQVTLLPRDLLGVDALILFSDILVIVECLGLTLDFPGKGGPRIWPALSKSEETDALQSLNVTNCLSYVLETIRRVKLQTHLPLIGFCGGPFTVATYCLDSWSQSAFAVTQRFLKEDPEGLKRFLDKIAEVTITYVLAQLDAGVDVIQVFDSWANILDLEQFRLFSLPYLKRIVDAVGGRAPVILFSRNSSLRAADLAGIKPACISLDEACAMAQMRRSIPSSIAIQGNFPPSLLKSPLAVIDAQIQALLTSMRGEEGFIVNLGHGVLPDTPFHHVQHFVDRVKNFV
jgi:uroporphyrinogen decarboxylase